MGKIGLLSFLIILISLITNYNMFSKNIALNKIADASDMYYIPSYANDGDVSTYWNSGQYASATNPQYIQIDLGSPSEVNKIRLKVGQNPYTGHTWHQIWFNYPNQSSRNICNFHGDTSNGQWLEYTLPYPDYDVTSVIIATYESPSWIAWTEIEVYDSNNNNIALNKPAYAPNIYKYFDPLCTHSPLKAIDGDPATIYDLNRCVTTSYPAYFKIDLCSSSKVDKIRLQVCQSEPGDTKHIIKFEYSNGAPSKIIHTFEGNTNDGDWLEYRLPVPEYNVQYVVVNTEKSQGILKWREIEVYGQDKEIARNNLKYFGYYYGVWDEFELISDHCNIAFIPPISSPEDRSLLKSYLNTAHSTEIRIILYITNFLNADNSLDNNILPDINTYINNGTIVAFYFHDEPDAYNFPPQVVENIGNSIKNLYPKIPLMLNLVYYDRNYFSKIPACFDWVTFDRYLFPSEDISMRHDNVTESNIDYVFSYYTSLIDSLKSKMNSNQKLAIIGESSIVKPVDNYSDDTINSELSSGNPFAKLQYNRILWARKLYNYMKTRNDIVFFMPFLWIDSGIDNNTISLPKRGEILIGLNRLPMLQDEFRRIGKEIKHNYNLLKYMKVKPSIDLLLDD